MKTGSFRERIRKSMADENLQIALDGNARRRLEGRHKAFESLPDHQERRKRAQAIKADVIHNLNDYLQQFMARVTGNGIIVHRAADGFEAIQIFLRIAKSRDARLIAKSKSMVSEEINFNHAVEAAGMRVVETDLGEYIIQLRGERPSHILTPAVHLRRNQVGSLFQQKLGVAYTEDIPELVAIARRSLREVFLTADIGVSGVNFGVAESGTLCLVTNEGNGRMVTGLPPVHVALMGIERLVPTLDDLALFLSLLPRSGTGQKLSVYTSLIHSPKRATDQDGPGERHLILVDNGRSRLRESSMSEALACIRCGACLNACPVFREIGGHGYLGRDGDLAPYPGPIGSVISAGLFGSDNYGHLAQASTLCGACKDACPVDINLPELLLRVRAGDLALYQKSKNPDEGTGIPVTLKLVLKIFRAAAMIPGLYRIGQRLAGFFSQMLSPKSKYFRLPVWTGWGYSKDLPKFEARPFRVRWQGIPQKIAQYPQEKLLLEETLPTDPPFRYPPETVFINELTAVGGIIHHIGAQDVQLELENILKERGIERIQVDSVGEKYAGGFTISRIPDPDIRAGVTGARMGIAETGSVVLSSGESGLTASLLPEVHIAILKSTDIVPTLSEALARRELREVSAATIITGPSRTADIEMALTIGVHGPKELHVILIKDNE